MFFALIQVSIVDAATSKNTVQSIRSNSAKDKLQLVVGTANSPEFQVFSLSDPIRIVIDVKASLSSGYRNLLDFKNRGVLRVRTGAKSESETRIVVDLRRNYRWKVYSMKPENKKGNRLVIEIYDSSVDSKVAQNENDNKNIEQNNNKVIELESAKKSVADNSKGKKVQLESIDKTGNSTNNSIAKGTDKKAAGKSKDKTIVINKSVKPSKSNEIDSVNIPSKSTHSRDIIVMIDPGHGGKDSGAIGSGKTKEKDVVLKIARKLKNDIDAMHGMKAILTRDSDVYISLRGRINLARKNNADLFISIHADAFISPDAQGSSVFILSNKGASSEAAKWLAQSENASDLKYGIDIGDYDADVSKVLLDIQQNATLETSYLLAHTTLGQLSEVGKTHRGKVERAGFVVLKSPDIPSMLVETAFISNPVEEKKLNTDAYQSKIAESIATSVKKYYDNHLPHHLLIIEPNS